MKEKIRLIIIIVLMGMLAASAFVGIQTYNSKRAVELQRDSLRNENETLSRKVEEIAKERKQLQDKVNALSSDLDKASQEGEGIRKQYELIVKERDDLVEKIKALEKDNGQLRGDLSNLQRERQRLGQKLEDNLAPIKNENAQLKEQLDNLSGLKSKLETELGQLKGEKSDLEQKLSQIDSVLQQNLTRLRYASIKEQLDAIRGGTPETPTAQPPAQPERESVELPPIVVRPQTQPKAKTPVSPRETITPAKPTGTVLEINRENKFVIVDLGEDAGTKVGDTFKVYKEGKPVADVEVIQVRQSIAACDIKEETTPVEVGSIVR